MKFDSSVSFIILVRYSDEYNNGKSYIFYIEKGKPFVIVVENIKNKNM